jgi:two-component system, cell cycle sensor histidine kinase and response regulator CckA
MISEEAIPLPGLVRAAGILVRNRMDRMLLAEALDELGFLAHDLSEAAPGSGPWEAVDILLIDEPSAAGLASTVARVKSQTAPAFLPALVVVPRVGSAERWLRAGFDDVIRLPIPGEELRGRLRLHLRLRERTLEAERAVFDRLPLGLFRANGRGEIVTANPAMASLLGFSSPTALQEAGPLFDGIRLPPLSRLFGAQEERTGGVELPWVRPDGILLWLRWTGRLHEDRTGQVLLGEGAVEDVTVQRRTKEELESSRALNVATIDSLGANLAILDPVGTIMSANQAWRTFPGSLAFGGKGPEEGLGVGVNYLDACDRTQGPAAELAGRASAGIRSVLCGDAELFELEYPMGGSDSRWFRLRVTPLRRGDGLRTGDVRRGAVVTHLDITEKHRAQETLRTREEELRQAQKMEAVGRLAGGIAHDFNNLLTAIRSNTALLRDAFPADDPSVQEVEEIDGATERAGALTRQLLILSRHQVQSIKEFDLAVLVQETSQLLRRVIREDIRLELEMEGPAVIRGDSGNLEMVILNLVLNAQDAMPEGGSITLRVRPGEEGDGRPGQVTLEVEDTGEGMTEEVRLRAFEPFFTTKEPGRGTGLGLSIVHGIVEQMDGRVELDSAPGEGTRFRFHIPRHRPTRGEAASGGVAGVAGTPSSDSLSPPPRARPGETILLVEDDPQVRRPTERLLARLGYRVLSAGDGEDGLDILVREEGIDLILSDVVMPGLTGPGMIRRFRQMREEGELGDRREPRILFVSGYTEREVDFFQRGSGSAPPRLLPKPFDLPILAQVLREVLDAEADPSTGASGSGEEGASDTEGSGAGTLPSGPGALTTDPGASGDTSPEDRGG